MQFTKGTVLWLLAGASLVQWIINLYLLHYKNIPIIFNPVIFLIMAVMFLGLLCIVPNKTLNEILC